MACSSLRSFRESTGTAQLIRLTRALAVSQTLENKAAARADLTPGVTDAVVAALERNHFLTRAQTRCVIYVLEQETDAYIEGARLSRRSRHRTAPVQRQIRETQPRGAEGKRRDGWL